jgi:hypothetical protein
MLNAIMNGKKRGTGLAGIDLKIGTTEGAEDILTATLFERLAYLPDRVLVTFFSQLLEDIELGPLDNIQFWPQWSLNGKGAEPDVVLTFSERTVIVEAKRDDYKQQQDPAQLARELRAGWESGNIEDETLLLTVGGLAEYTALATQNLRKKIENQLNEYSRDFELICCSWRDLFQAMEYAMKQHKEEYGSGLERICDDIAAAYAWHGLRTHPMRFLNELSTPAIKHTSFPKFFLALESNPIQKAPPILRHPLKDLFSISINSTGNAFAPWGSIR